MQYTLILYLISFWNEIQSKTLFIILSLLPVLFSSCSKEVVINLAPHEEILVVDCIFSPDSVFKLTLSKSSSIFSNCCIKIESALIVIYENDSFRDTLKHKNGFYYSKVIPQVQSRYDLLVSSTGFDKLTAHDVLETKPMLGKSRFIPNIFTDQEAKPVSQAIIEIHDNGNKRNYYELVLKNRHKEPFLNREVIGNVVYATSPDQVLINDSDLHVSPGSIVFTNDLFAGQSYFLTINYIPQPLYAFMSPNNFVKYEHDLIISIRMVSENYYKYKKQLAKHIHFQNSNLWLGVGDPVPMYTNINGGLGIFAGFNQVTDTLYLLK